MANGQPPTEEFPPAGEVMADPPIGSTATVAIEIIREISRHILGLGSVAFILYMLYHFVEISAQKDNVMFLVIGNVMGFMMGIGTWYFGGAMKSGLAALRQSASSSPNTSTAPGAPMAARKP